MRPSLSRLALVLLPLLAACQPANPPADAAAASAAQAAPADAPANAAAPAEPAAQGDGLAAFLTYVYGPAARLQGEWTTVPVDVTVRARAGETANGTVTRRVCERDDTTLGGEPTVLLAVCGTPKDMGHATPGFTDLYVLQQQDGAWVARARRHFEEFGSMGSVGEVEGERLGAALAGFIVESGTTGQGHTVARHTVLLPKDGGFHEAATFLAGMDDDALREGCGTDGAPCPPGQAYDLEFALDIDDANPAAEAYPLTVHEQGEACGARVDVRHTLTLDAATQTYRVPDALRRELPCAPASP
jgi:FtsP/CotA-like multicopper oxidase with cupredoxin domain